MRQLPISPDCVFDASLVPGTCPGRFLDLKGLINKFLESPDCVFDASLVPGTCPGRFLDLKGLINKFLESRLIGHLPRTVSGRTAALMSAGSYIVPVAFANPPSR